MAKNVFGIDLGTTYSCISYVDEYGKPVVIKNTVGQSTTPSVVQYESKSNVIVGEVAKNNAVLYPKQTISLVKTLMGKTDFAIEFEGEVQSPEEVSALILRKLAEDAGKEAGIGEVKDVVITCPAYFGDAARKATKNAGVIAGLNVLEIISEPVAAALFYGCTKSNEDKTILVYDLGGGTFDVTIMSIGISNNTIEVICSEGIRNCGGRNWDEAVIEYLKNEFIEKTGFTGTFDEYDEQSLRIDAEKAKQGLTAREKTTVPLQLGGKRSAVELTRETFDEITSGLLNETIEETTKAINIAKEKGYSVDEILLVGGSTKMLQVAKRLSDEYGITPKEFEQDEAVAKGAAIHAVDVYIHNKKSLQQWRENEDNPSNEIEKEVLDASDNYNDELNNESLFGIGGRVAEKINVIYSTTKSYALAVVVDKTTGKEMCHNMIFKNNPMPDGITEKTGKFGTLEDNQESIDIIVYENDSAEQRFEIDESLVLGNVELELPPHLPDDSPLEVTFSLNSQGILSVTGRELTEGRECHATMNAKGVMSAEKVEEKKKKVSKISIQI